MQIVFLAPEVQAERIIIKPYNDSNSNGLHLVGAMNWEGKIAELQADHRQYYIVQEFIADSVLYRNRKTDLRVHVGVFRWEPLKYRIYRAGVPRVPNAEFWPDAFPDENRCITMAAVNDGHIEHHITTEEYFNEIPEDNDLLWPKIGREIGVCLQAVWLGRHILDSFLMPGEDPANTMRLMSFDVMLRHSSDGVQPCILETGYSPALYRSPTLAGSERVNLELDRDYRQFFEDARDHMLENAERVSGSMRAGRARAQV